MDSKRIDTLARTLETTIRRRGVAKAVAGAALAAALGVAGSGTADANHHGYDHGNHLHCFRRCNSWTCWWVCAY